MLIPLVWSERPEPNAPRLKDCVYSGGLQALVFSGFAAFPLGMYTVAEREALERSDNQPDETGGSLADLILAVRNRYGITWTISSTSAMSAHHARSDLAFVITGTNGNLTAGHYLRRWDVAFTGGHCVTIIPTGDGTYVRWLDPLAPNKYPGDTADWTTVMRWIGAMPTCICVRGEAPPKYTQAQYDAATAAARRVGYADAKRAALAAVAGV